MSPTLIGAVLFSALLHAGWNALLRQSEDRSWTAGWIGAATMIVCAPFLPFVGWPTTIWPYVLASASLHVVYLGLLAKAYRLNELSFAYPIARGSSPVLVAVGGLILAAEQPSWLQAVGIFSIVAGIIGIGLDSTHWDREGLIVALQIGAVIAVYTVLDGMGARRGGNSLQYNLWCFSIYGAAMLVRQFKTLGPKAFHGNAKDVGLAFGGGVTSVVAYGIVTWAMVHTKMGVVSALRETSIVFASVIGMVLLKEKFSSRKLAWSTLIAVGAVLIGISSRG